MQFLFDENKEYDISSIFKFAKHNNISYITYVKYGDIDINNNYKYIFKPSEEQVKEVINEYLVEHLNNRRVYQNIDLTLDLHEYYIDINLYYDIKDSAIDRYHLCVNIYEHDKVKLKEYANMIRSNCDKYKLDKDLIDTGSFDHGYKQL